jgi:3-dehydroquinate dehydratase/shikimate dehydrogenase
MADIYRYDKVGPDTEVYGVIADPLGQDIASRIYNAGFDELDLNKVYLPFRVPVENLDEFLADCRQLGVCGLSVMVPHQAAVIPKLTKVDGAVRGVGAANTIVFQGDDLIGYNTVYRAAMDCIDAIAGSRSDSLPLSGRKALVLGAGALAKAVIFGLRRRGAEVAIANRTFERAGELAKEFGCTPVEWEKRHTLTPAVLVNSTPVGMHPNVDESPFDKQYLRPAMIVLDTVYNPEQTLLVKDARDRRCRVVTGVEMFVRQAAVQFRHFTGQAAPMDRMRDSLKGAIGAVRR